MNDQQQRLEALKLYNKVIRTRRFEKYQKRKWRDGGSETASRAVVAVLSSDRVIDAERRVERAGGEADVVVYWPEDDRITIAHVTATNEASVLGVDPVGVHENSTVAMLWSLITAASGVVFTSSRAEVMA